MTEPILAEQRADAPSDRSFAPTLSSVPPGPLSLVDLPRGLAVAGTGRVNQLLLALEALATSPPELRVCATTVCWLARALTGADGAILEDAEGAELVPGTAEPSSELPLHQAGFVLSGLAARTGELQHCDDASDDPRCDPEACRRLGIASMVAVPLFHDGRLVAVLKVVAGSTDRFDERADATLLTLAPSMAARLHHAAEASTGPRASTARAHGAAAERGEAPVDESSLRDPLTGLANRWAFLADLERTIDGMGEDEECAVLFLGLDHFEEVKAAMGQEAGTDLLCRTAAVLRRLVRDKDEIARLAGNQFVVLVRGVYDLGTVGGLADRIQRAVSGLDGCGISVTASVGVAMAHNDDDPVEVLRTADDAMAEAERAGGGVAVLDEGTPSHFTPVP